ncbi:TetR/AcrR family transcriptional regulator [Nocardia takedensis]|uniref:TetR/AcrR family transcriptional regulator n=1 Tax=Nocardia takedensis TaxID=259390 RepID=UPI0003129348|nr:TetR/AcrR family transcriptional regulator [Nocardia takedensis]
MVGERSYHHGDLRAQLLERAELTLREGGVERLSLRRVARELGVTHNAPSRHFADKQALLDALAQNGFQRLGEVFRVAADRVRDKPFDERVQALARAYLDFALEHSALLTLMFARKHSPSGGAEMAAAVTSAFAVPVALTTDGQKRGEVVDGDPIRIGWTVAIAMQGLASFATAGLITDDNLDDLVTETVTRLTYGLTPQGPAS